MDICWAYLRVRSQSQRLTPRGDQAGIQPTARRLEAQSATWRADRSAQRDDLDIHSHRARRWMKATISGMVSALAIYEMRETSVARLLTNGGMIETAASVACPCRLSGAPG